MSEQKSTILEIINGMMLLIILARKCFIFMVSVFWIVFWFKANLLLLCGINPRSCFCDWRSGWIPFISWCHCKISKRWVVPLSWKSSKTPMGSWINYIWFWHIDHRRLYKWWLVSYERKTIKVFIKIKLSVVETEIWDFTNGDNRIVNPVLTEGRYTNEIGLYLVPVDFCSRG